MTVSKAADLSRLLADIRRDLAAKVEADGADAHQVEIDQLVW